MMYLKIYLLLALFVVGQSVSIAADNHEHDATQPGHAKETEIEDEHLHDAEEAHDEHLYQAVNAEGDGHAHDEDEENVVVKFDAAQLQMAGIEVAVLQPRRVSYEVYAPGEIRANGYTSYIVSPRTDSVVVQRHAALGEYVEAGQPLVTLFSEAVTEAQASYQLAAAEWARVQRLGRAAVGEKRYVEARTSFERTQGRLRAFGVSDEAISALRTSRAEDLGTYSLSAAIAGVVLSDSFSQGQRVNAGDTLMELADEDELWVEVRLSPDSDIRLPAGSPAHVKVGRELYPAVVVQEGHTIDPITRTRIVRLVVGNAMHRLHPGMFADVYFEFSVAEPVLAVPEAALMRSVEGHWTVFVEDEPGVFSATEVERGRSLGNLQEISGVPAGTRVVMRSAFFVASQLAKSGFDPHNH